jgi:predicted RNase H-like HicB family nuclease
VPPGRRSGAVSACRLHARVRRQGPRDAKLLILSYRELRMALELTAVFRKVPEGYIAFVEELPGANTQGATLEEARANLREAVELTLEANRALAEEDLAGADVIREPLKLTA